jgi:uncharacterized repeat protein (TIGR01451 family)
MWFSTVVCWPERTRRSPPPGRPTGRRPQKFVPVLESLEERLAPAGFRVTSLADSNAAGSGSLRRALTESNATAGPNQINILTPGTYNLTIAGDDEGANVTGDLNLANQDVTIVNQSGSTVVINQTTNDRVFDISQTGPAINVTITGVTIQGGEAEGPGGGILVRGTSSVVLSNDIVQKNSADFGGGIGATDGAVAIQNSLIANNSSTFPTAGRGGGGLYLNGRGRVTIDNSEFTDNSAAGDGGGLLIRGHAKLTISSCTFNKNRAGGNGGGLALESDGSSDLTDATVSGNSAVTGGGLAVTGAGNIALINDTIAFNSAVTAGGAFAISGALAFFNTIVAKNTAAGAFPDVDNSGTAVYMVDWDHNFIGDNTGAADSFPAGTPNINSSFVGSAGTPLDPLLEPLADNGGVRVLPDGSHPLTHQDEANSGNNGVRDRASDHAAPFDERGFGALDGHPDIGAFEFQDFDLAVSTSAPPGTVRVGLPVTFTITVHNLGPNLANSITVTDTLPPGTTVVRASGNATVSGNVVTFALPGLLSGDGTSFTLTVIPAVPGLFTAKAAVSFHDDPNLANNTATASVTVLPRPFPATGFADVTGFVRVVRQGRRPRRRLLFLLTNTSGTLLQGPLGLVVAGLPRGVKLLNAGGLTANRQKFVRVDVGGDNLLDPGERAAVQLVFSQPFRPHRLRVLAGAFA